MPWPSGTRIACTASARSPRATSNRISFVAWSTRKSAAARAEITRAAVSTIWWRRSELRAGAAIVRAVAAFSSASRSRAASCCSVWRLVSEDIGGRWRAALDHCYEVAPGLQEDATCFATAFRSLTNAEYSASRAGRGLLQRRQRGAGRDEWCAGLVEQALLTHLALRVLLGRG